MGQSPRRWHYRCSSATRSIRGSAAPTRTRTDLHKNADLATFTQDELNAVAAKLNHRPRRVLGWATPAEAFGTAEPKPMLLAPA